MCLLVVMRWMFSVGAAAPRDEESETNGPIGYRCVLSQYGKVSAFLKRHFRHKILNPKDIFSFCAIRKLISDPQASCRGNETLNEGQSSSWKRVSSTSSADSIRTTFWLLQDLMLWVEENSSQLKKLSSFAFETALIVLLLLLPPILCWWCSSETSGQQEPPVEVLHRVAVISS